MNIKNILAYGIIGFGIILIGYFIITTPANIIIQNNEELKKIPENIEKELNNNSKIMIEKDSISWEYKNFESWKDIEKYFNDIDYTLNTKEIPTLIIESFPENFKNIPDVNKKKEMFVQIVLPIILKINKEISFERDKLFFYIKNDMNDEIEILKEKYSAKNIEDLKIKINTIPVHIAIGQSAKESGWGSSRFTVEGNNIFGEWTFEPGTGIVPSGRPEGATYEVKKFDNIEQSMKSYAEKLNTLDYYEDFRLIRSGKIKDKRYEDGLLYYSQQRELYVSSLKSLIDSNNFEKYSDYYLEVQNNE
ncbi:glucosaminidase domain-containing protein [Oceanotoga teriensis]|uniref:glucosaminidase domain-containing protein n=1 Tax=Oceanotoga teriensis TaxID=515440 RepID=UPI0027131D5E|nr:glucosaminidase domain-containing protein [Oceanotoga teriensis]MDO7977876.1 glucosaminidase domain-containing protein [Oceanotoga teriensis]